MISIKKLCVLITACTLSVAARHTDMRKENENETVIILGSGPAALMAATYAARENMKPLVFKGPNPGGQLENVPTITNWPGEISISGADLIKRLTDQAEEAGTRFIDSTIKVVECTNKPIQVTTTDNKVFTADTLIIATGSDPRKLGIKGEKEYWGKGVSICALCDGPFFQDKPIVIVGDGYLALKNACTMKNQTSNITMILPGNKLKGPRLLREQVKGSGIKFIKNAQVKRILGNGSLVTGIEIVVDGTEKIIPTEAVFVSIGFKPNTDIVRGQVALDSTGKININKKCETNVPGVFAAGSCTNTPNPQAVVCAAGGCISACETDKYLDKQLFRMRSKL